MTRYLMVIESRCKDSACEAEFTDWYENIHIPDVLAQPDFKKATRWVDIDSPGGEPGYIALYEIETRDLAKTMETEQKTIAQLKAKNRLSDQFVLVSRHIYKLISSASK